MADRMLSEIPRELHSGERTVFRKRTFDFDTWTFKIRIESEKIIPTCVIVGFTESDKFEEQPRDGLVFDWLPVPSAVCRLDSGR